MWGDGKYDYVTTAKLVNGVLTPADGVASASKAHTYTTAGNKLVQIYVYKAGVQKALIKQTIIVDGAN